MPAKIRIEMPLPTFRSLMISPIHMRSMVPAAMVIMVVTVFQASMSDSRLPEDCFRMAIMP